MKKSTRNLLLAGVAAVAFLRYEAYTRTADPTEARVNAKNYRAYMDYLKNVGWQGPESEYHDSLPGRTNAHFGDVASKLRVSPNEYMSLVVVHAFDGHPTHVWLRSKKPDGDLYAPVPTVSMLNDVVAAVPPGFVIDGLDDPQSVAPQAQAQATTASSSDGSGWTSPPIVLQLIQTAAMVGIAVWFIMGMRGGGQAGAMKLLKSRHKSFDKLPKVRFKDVAGVDEAKDDLMDVVRFLKDPTEFTRLGGRMPKGILLVGPPGTGKTLLCRAVAGEADIPAFYINASEFVEMFVGVGASRIRTMFEEIRKAGRAILVIDELDALGKHRGTGVGGGNDEREQALNQLLTEIDGFETHELITFGLTNRPDVLDPALLRPGRFGDKKVTVGRPDKQGRREIINIYAPLVKLEESINLEEVAKDTLGMVGAELESVFRLHAPWYAVRRCRRDYGDEKKADIITRQDLYNAISEVRHGSPTYAKSQRLVEKFRKLLTYHELSHAMVGKFLSISSNGYAEHWCDYLTKITIIGAGGAGGYCEFNADEDEFTSTYHELIGRITLAVAARIGELIFLGDASTGCSGDNQQLYGIAKKMVTRWAMSELGPICVGEEDQSTPFLGKTLATSSGYGVGPHSSDQIDRCIFLIIADCCERAERILLSLQDVAHFMAPDLMKDETWSGAEFDAKWNDYFRERPLPVIDLTPMTEEELVDKVPRVARILGRLPNRAPICPAPTAPPANV